MASAKLTAPVTNTESEGVAAEWVDIDAIRPWGENPRPLKKHDVRVLARSIKRFGFGAPILARRENGEIIAGHARFAAARSLRLQRVPVRFLELSANEAHTLALADNKIQEGRSWDEQALARIVDELQSFDVDVSIGTGFTDEYLQKLCGDDDDSVMQLGNSAEPSMGSFRYQLLVTCEGEEQQGELLERLESEGLRVKPVVS